MNDLGNAPSNESPADKTLVVDQLATHFDTRAGLLKAVDGVSFSVDRGEILGLVGESGSGKSVTGFSILGLVDEPGEIVGGSVKFCGQELVGRDDRAMQGIRGNRMAMIFQDPMMTLNPVLRIDTQMVETVLAHQTVSRAQARQISLETLAQVGIPAPESRLKNYPHELSGGMRQRVAIAIALLNKPDLIVADEPTTALDVTIQAQILYEVQQLCQQTGTAMIWITHDLAVVAGLAQRIAVMYAGRLVEYGTTDDVIDSPRHPYTVGLLNSVPSAHPRGSRLQQIPGMTPNPINMAPGCPFKTRCPRATERCNDMPSMMTPPEGSAVRCHYPHNMAEVTA